MSTSNRHTLFLDDALSSNELELDSPKLASSHPKRLQRRRIIGGQDAYEDKDSAEAKAVSTYRRFPIKHANHSNKISLVPVLTGSPWNHYEKRYRVKYGHSFGVITSRNAACRSFMIRTLTGRAVEEHIQNIRQLCHSNLVKNIEIYGGSDSSYFLISEFMPTSLLHLCRSPIYPTEPQLSSIVHQVLTGLEFLVGCGLVHEKLSCANLLVNFAGEVKICDIENCRRPGNLTELLVSLNRVMMKLMDKERAETAAVGLTHPDKWSHEAIDLFTAVSTTPDIQKLLAHDFLLKKNQEELLWLIPFVLITANHDRE